MQETKSSFFSQSREPTGEKYTNSTCNMFVTDLSEEAGRREGGRESQHYRK